MICLERTLLNDRYAALMVQNFAVLSGKKSNRFFSSRKPKKYTSYVKTEQSVQGRHGRTDPSYASLDIIETKDSRLKEASNMMVEKADRTKTESLCRTAETSLLKG